MTISLHPERRTKPLTPEERSRFLSSILESFAGTLDLREVLRRVANVTLESFGADRVLLLHPIREDSAATNVRFALNAPHLDVLIGDAGPVPLTPAIMRRALASPRPVVVREGDPDADDELARQFGIRASMLQILRPEGDEPWAFGIHQCAGAREWSEDEIALFAEIGRYATLALNNTLLHDRVVRHAAKVSAMLEQIPEPAAIYDATGRRERMNAAAVRQTLPIFAGGLRSTDGTLVAPEELPSMRALRGEAVKSDYRVRDPRGGEDRLVTLTAGPVRDDQGRIIGSVVLSRDITEERQNSEREAWRRRRAECLANLGLDPIVLQPDFDNLDETTARVARAVRGTARIHLYRPATGFLELAGYAGTPLTEEFREFFRARPYRPGEGLPGTVFQIGRPLLFYDVRGNDLVDFSRDEDEKQAKAAMHERSLIACPIESYGDRIGALVLSQSEPGRNFGAEHLEFAQAIAERIGSAAHVHRLTRMSVEGHRAADELARHEVDARVRFEAVLETAPIGIAVISPDELRFDLANARWLDFASHFGRIGPNTPVIGSRIDEVIPGWELTLKRVAESGESRFDEAYEISTRSGPLYVNRIISAVRGRFSGITQSITVLIQDVSDAVRAKREIEALAQMMAERSARLDSILGSMTDALWVYNATGEVVDVNQSALTMFGIGSRTEAVEFGSFERFELRYPDGRPVPRHDLPHARALRGAVVPDYLAIGRHLISGKDLDLSIAAAPIESNGVVGAVLVIRDITALQELDRKKDEFLSVASHELRTPLTTIKGYTQLLAQAASEVQTEERVSYLNSVLSEVDRMMGLITELLDVSRIETNRLQIEPQPIRWLDFLKRRATAFRVQNPARNITFRAEIPEATLQFDPDRMRQVVDNLLSNAIKYSPESSEIQVHTVIEGRHMLTSVIDQGIGIPKDEIPRLFERFHRARNVSSRYYGGLGLGLYIARAIVEAHNGSISVLSEEGKGSTFIIRLPMP